MNSKPHDPPPLMIHELAGKKAVEAYHLALYLGYAQQHLLRKQVLTDWDDIFEEGVDYEMIHEADELRRYEREHERRLFGELRPMSPARGRLFFLEAGLRKLLRHTTKDTSDLELELARAGILPQTAPPLERGGPSSLVTDQPGPLEHGDPAERSRPSLEERKFEYEVLERLLAHLREIEDRALQDLAITSAEAALARPLEELRSQLETSRATAALANLAGLRKPGRPPERPLFFEIPGTFFSLKEIGYKAGGYSSSAAGKAANVVAERRGYTPDQIRRQKLSFNQLLELPDPRGKLRKMYRFDGSFANEVVAELRSNPSFSPAPVPELEDFGVGGERYPKLSRGPFEDEEEAPSPLA